MSENLTNTHIPGNEPHEPEVQRTFQASLTGLDRLHEEMDALDKAYQYMEIHHAWNGKDPVSTEQAQSASRIAAYILNPVEASVQHESAPVKDLAEYMRRLDGEYRIMGGVKGPVSTEQAGHISEKVKRALPPTSPTA